MSLIALGIGAIIGAGLFVRTAAAIAERSGPSVTLAFLVAGLGCAFAGLCYAEFASMIPIAGSAYTYAYATLGELVAWMIGWDLILEYAVGSMTVAIGWSGYMQRLLAGFGIELPMAIVRAIFRGVRPWVSWATIGSTTRRCQRLREGTAGADAMTGSESATGQHG